MGGSTVTATGTNAVALLFQGGSGETNTLTALDSVFTSTSGAGIFVETMVGANTIDATILGNTIDSALSTDLELDNSSNGTLNILGAADGADLTFDQNDADSIFTIGTINFVP